MVQVLVVSVGIGWNLENNVLLVPRVADEIHADGGHACVRNLQAVDALQP